MLPAHRVATGMSPGTRSDRYLRRAACGPNGLPAARMGCLRPEWAACGPNGLRDSAHPGTGRERPGINASYTRPQASSEALNRVTAKMTRTSGSHAFAPIAKLCQAATAKAG